MSTRLYPKAPLLGACTAIWRGDKVLLALRARPPHCDKWAMPGGMAEVGETLAETAIREVREETGLAIANPVFNRFHEIIHRDAEDKVEMHFVLAMFVARSKHGEAVAGDDAADIRWCTIKETTRLPLTPQTDVFLEESLKLLPGLT